MKTTTKAERISVLRANHHAALARIGEACGMKSPDGLKLWRSLRRIEAKASAACVAQCNGEAYEGQPYREEKQWEAFRNSIRAAVARTFGGKEPEGFFLNTDPRGHALKLDASRMESFGRKIPDGLVTDWGGYGILAAEITD